MTQISKGIVMTGIASLAAIEIVALIMGVNGVLFTIIVAAIAAAIGVTLPQPKFK